MCNSISNLLWLLLSPAPNSSSKTPPTCLQAARAPFKNPDVSSPPLLSHTKPSSSSWWLHSDPGPTMLWPCFKPVSSPGVFWLPHCPPAAQHQHSSQRFVEMCGCITLHSESLTVPPFISQSESHTCYGTMSPVSPSSPTSITLVFLMFVKHTSMVLPRALQGCSLCLESFSSRFPHMEPSLSSSYSSIFLYFPDPTVKLHPLLSTSEPSIPHFFHLTELSTL